jgi:hypothetical protein
MREYEIRILKPDSALVLALNGSYLNDFSAIRTAQNIWREGQSAQVSRDDVCIYLEDKTAKKVMTHHSAVKGCCLVGRTL